MEPVSFELIHKYKTLFDEIKLMSNKLLSDILKVDDNTFDIIANLSGIFYNRQAKAMNLNHRMRGSAELREIFSFVAMLYFDYRAQEVSDYLKVSRAMSYWYCQKVIDKFLMYSQYREKCLTFFTHQEMTDMIVKFSDKKRNK